MSSEIIDGPIGPFLIPSEPAETRRICAALSRGVWGSHGRYDRPEAGVPEYEHVALSIPGVHHVIDVGAGWGAFAVWAIARWGRDILLECYEPNGQAAEILARNVGEAARVRVHPVAVTVDARAVLASSEDWGCRKTSGATEGDRVFVEHPAMLPPCDVLKCDAEGVEPELFAAYRHLPFVKAAIYEWHAPEHRRELRQICAAAGLTCVRDEIGPFGSGSGVGVWVQRGTA